MPTHPCLFDADYSDSPPPAGELLARVGLMGRQWDAVTARYGFDGIVTYAALGARYGVSRARAQQVVINAARRLGGRIWILAPALDILESLGKALEQPALDNLLDIVVADCQAAFCAAGREDPTTKDIERLLIVARVCVDSGHPKIQTWYPRFTLAACGLHPVIGTQRLLAAALKRHASEWTYERLARFILSQARTPLTVAEIARRAERLQRRPRLAQSQMARTLADSASFARVGHGLYGLPFWGYKPLPTYPEIIEKALRSAGKALSYGQIFQAASAVRTVNEATLRMRLDRHPLFYRSKNNLYGLREWLPPREKQTLRTPAGLVEDAGSYKRLRDEQSGGEDDT